jgi:Protein of unknown function (DUF2934)
MAEPRARATSQSRRLQLSDQEWYERVARKAYELYQQRGEAPGDELADWLLAERLVQEELLHGPVPEEPLLDDEEQDR